MERQKRASDTDSSLWENPCDYNNSSSKPDVPPDDYWKFAEKLVKQAKSAHTFTAGYKDSFAQKLHSFGSFDDLLVKWEKYDWLRKFDWMPEDGFPKEKILYKAMPDEYMNQLMGKIDDVLPGMIKGLKMIVAGLNAFSKDGLNSNIIDEENLKESINETMHQVGAVLCYFSDIMKFRNLTIPPLPDSEVPNFNTNNKINDALLLYRDTLNYLEYLGQVFQKLYNIKS